MGRGMIFSIAAAGVALAAVSASAQTADHPTIVLVGGMKTGLPDAEHDFPDGVLKLERLIKASPDFAKVNPVLKVYPVGFPKDLSELDGADVVVLYTGTQRTAAGSAHPIEDPAVKAAMTKLMAAGTGLVALHQSFTVADKGSVPLDEWLGGHRIAVTDYTFENAPVTVAAKAHPAVNGVASFNYLDEFYPTVNLASKVTPVLTAKVHVQNVKSGPVFREPSQDRVVAWAYERPNGGRSFGYSGGHYLASFDQPEVRTMVLNSILWAARANVPAAGVTTSIPAVPTPGRPVPVQPHKVILPASEATPLPQPWGKLEWFASRAIGNSTTMTVGRATITPGQLNPPHWHPNCDEILHVVKGHIMHRVGDKEYEMRTGDTVVIPEGTVHNARNIGTEDAVLMVSFNSADRVAIGE